MKKEMKYINFPISFLKNDDINTIIINAIAYQLYSYSFNKKITMEKSIEYFGVEVENIIEMEIMGKELYNKYLSSPHTGVSVDKMLEFINLSKSDYEIDVFRAFCAVRSIIGQKKYRKTNKALILARMYGYNVYSEIPCDFEENKKKYEKRYHMDMILNELQINWHLKIASGGRGFYISFVLSLTDLFSIIYEAKKATQIKKLIEAKKIAKKIALEKFEK